MAAESKAEIARREAREKAGLINRKLPTLWRGLIYLSLAVLTLSKLIYSIGWFKTRTSNNCVFQPSDLDIFMQDLTTIAAVLLVTSLVMGLHHLENK